MDDTPNLKLPYILAAQAQKHVTHNEAIRALDAIVQIGVADRDLTVPPASPAEGDRYIVGAGATGAWSGKDGQVAAWQDGAWMFYEPLEGWLAWVADEDALVAWDGTAWVAAASGGASTFIALTDTPAAYIGAAGKMAVVNSGETALEFADEVPLIGINATPDATNRLALASAASLFNHAGAGHQHKINKSAAGDTASILFQTGFSGRAEFGTTGDDDWHVKVSPDGTTWHEALVADKDSGRIGLGTAAPARRLDVLDASGPQLRLTNTAGLDHADLEVDSGGDLSIAPSGGEVGVYVDNAGGEVLGAALTIEQDGAGDSVLQWLLTATRAWYAGVDNSDSDTWKLASTTGTPDFASDTKVSVDTSGNLRAAGYLRAGSLSAPVNTTAGDLTATRFSLGNSALDSNGRTGKVTGTQTATASGSDIMFGCYGTLTPGSNSSADFRVLNMETQPNAVGINLNLVQAGYFINRVLNSGTIAEAIGVRAAGLFLGGSSVSMGTVALAAGIRTFGVTSFSNSLTSTVTTAHGVLVDNSSAGSGPLSITGLSGVTISEQTPATNNTNLLLGTSAVPSGAWNLYSPSTRNNYLAGALGIGTTGADRKLHVEADDATNNAVTRLFRLTHTTSGTPAVGIGIGLELEVETSAGNNEVIAAIDAVATTVTGASEVGALLFKTMDAGAAAAERMRIAGDGNVGVGTTSPSTKLHVDGPLRVGSYAVAGAPSASAAGAGAIIYVSDEAGGAVLAFSDGASWRRVTDRAVIS